MFRKVLPVLFAGAVMALAGCSGSTNEPTTEPTSSSITQPAIPTSPEETTVTINGKEWTCEQITASEPQKCGELTQQVFDRYKENIDAYVNSGRLGPLNDGEVFIYEDAAFAGLVACAYILDNRSENDYIDFMLKTPPFEEQLQERVMYLPAWHEAPKTLCTDLTLPNQNPGSSRIP